MRFAAIADVHGNYLALEAVVADIRAHDIDEIVNLGDMASGPLDARRTMDALMALDAVHVLGNHDRYLIDRPPEKMGSWDRPARAQLDAGHLDWLRAVPPKLVFRDQVFLCHATPDSDEVYWLETVLLDGTVRMSSLEVIEEAAKRHRAAAYSVRPQPYRARGPAWRRAHGGQSRQRRLARLSRCPSVSACHGSRHAGRTLRDPGIGR
jgi:3',5'-cyclic AMP phosphodiesterase CpdA